MMASIAREASPPEAVSAKVDAASPGLGAMRKPTS